MLVAQSAGVVTSAPSQQSEDLIPAWPQVWPRSTALLGLFVCRSRGAEKPAMEITLMCAASVYGV